MCIFRLRRAYVARVLTGIALLLLTVPGAARAAGLTGLAAGPYRADLWTEPAVVPVGKARLFVRLRSDGGAPVTGATVRTLVRMPAMDMEERETTAAPQTARPGVYVAPAAFAMAGEYAARISITGPAGAATLTASIATGQTTAAPDSSGSGAIPAAPRGFSWPGLIGVAAAALVAFVVYRLLRLGVKPDIRGLTRPRILLSLLLVVAVVVLSRLAIARLRPPGAMTPVEAQAMNMALPAPPNPAPVELATVREGSLESAVRYTGQAVGYAETVIAARAGGWVEWMPSYVGDRLRRGQRIARLDTSQTGPEVAGREAQVAMARQEEAASGSEYRAKLAEIRRMQAEARGKRAASEAADAEVAAMRAEQAEALAEQSAMREDVTAARADLGAAEADVTYWREEIRRMESLLGRGAVSPEDFQREQAQTAAAEAKQRSAVAGLSKAEAQARAAGSRLARTRSQVTVTEKRRRQMRAESEGADAAISAARTEAEAAASRIGQAAAGARQARASLAGAAATRGYSEVRAPMDGVVTERLVSPGTLAAPGQALLKVAQVAPIRLQVFVPESDLPQIRRGAAVRAWPGTETGKRAPARLTVSSVGASFDPTSRMASVEAIYPNRDGRFQPGQAVTLQVVTGRSVPGSRIIPTRALGWEATGEEGGVISHDRRAYVWVVDAMETVRRVPVTVDGSGGTDTAIVAGLEVGQRVVTRGQEYLRPGDSVQAMAFGPDGPLALPSPAPAAPHKGGSVHAH